VGTVLSLVAVVAGRIIVGNRVGRKHRWTFANEIVIADGVPVHGQPGENIIDAREMALEPRCDDPVFLERLSRLLDRCDRVVVACAPHRGRAWSAVLKGMALDVEMLMPELTPLRATALGRFREETTLRVSSGPLGLRDRAVKRALDLITATVALALVAPLMVLLALAIKLESRGPIFFRQQRIGQNNRMFDVLKFRSMRTECTDHNADRLVSRNDDRLTRLGAFIRRTSLDELPQLFNVLKGDMSIVGPRPHALGATAENSLYWNIDSRYFHRHAIKPGITGLAQVRGFRGATVRRDDLTSRLQSDLEYVAGWTVLRDVRIIAATFRVLVHGNAF
jgi:lipopolysaccharide/colanic/teichoic acid biosynthesis glycosyltransferase